jgi:exodeoxyribonuclease VIII
MIVKLDAQAYHADPALSHSRLKVMGRSPAHFRWTSDNGHPSSDALDFGKLFHASILEPETVSKDFSVAPEGIDKRTTAGKAAWAKFVDESNGKTIVTAADMRTAMAMSAAINANEGARDIVFDAIATGRVEEAHKWLDPMWRVDRKSKMDAVLSDGTVVDIKTTVDASPRAFERSILSYGYHTQAAYYADAMDACGQGMRRFLIVAIEKTPPYAIGVYQVAPEAIAVGRVRVAEWLSRYVDCVSKGAWPSYTESFEVLGLPKWAAGKDSDGGAIVEEF